jgi:hypothetical protein
MYHILQFWAGSGPKSGVWKKLFRTLHGSYSFLSRVRVSRSMNLYLILSRTWVSEYLIQNSAPKSNLVNVNKEIVILFRYRTVDIIGLYHHATFMKST